jgi:Flp pilus assembly pilin Flp
VADDQAPTAMEYAFMVAGVALLIVAAVYLMGNRLGNLFKSSASHLP